MTEYTQSESLRKHMLAVEAAVRGYARLWGEDEEDWGVVALLHDFDYERYPRPGESSVPRRRDPEGAGLSGVGDARDPVARRLLGRAARVAAGETLFACDEMSGFVTAAALVRPSKSVLDLEAASVIKRMKDKAFARAVTRDDLRKGAEEIGLPARAAHHQRDRVHARAGRRAGAARDSVIPRTAPELGQRKTVRPPPITV